METLIPLSLEDCLSLLAERRPDAAAGGLDIVLDPAWIRDIPPAEQALLAATCPSARRILAAHEDTEPYVLAGLAHCLDMTVRALVAENSATAKEIRQQLISPEEKQQPADETPKAENREPVRPPGCVEEYRPYLERRRNQEPYYRFFRMLESLERHAELNVWQRWCDLGCNHLQLVYLLLYLYNLEVTGVDDFPEENVCEREIFGRKRLDYRQRDLSLDFDLKVPPFDFVSALEVIEHVVDTDRFLQQCRHWLRDDGLLVLSTPNINCLRNRLQVPLGRYPFGPEYRTVIHHVRMYNKATLIDHLHQNGFETLAVRGVSFLPMSVVTKGKILKRLSDWLADRWPSLCNNLIAIARKKL